MRGRDFHGGGRRWWECRKEEESERDKEKLGYRSVKRGVGRGIDAEKNGQEGGCEQKRLKVGGGKKDVPKILICTGRVSLCIRGKWVCISYAGSYASFGKNRKSEKLVVQKCIT